MSKCFLKDRCKIRVNYSTVKENCLVTAIKKVVFLFKLLNKTAIYKTIDHEMIV